MSTEQANFRLNAKVKHKAYAILQRLGIRPSEAVNMLMHHVAMFEELPFRPGVPNATTLTAIEEGENTKNLKRYKRFKDVREELEI